MGNQIVKNDGLHEVDVLSLVFPIEYLRRKN